MGPKEEANGKVNNHGWKDRTKYTRVKNKRQSKNQQNKTGNWYERGTSGDLKIKMGLHRTYRTSRRDKMEENNQGAGTLTQEKKKRMKTRYKMA